MRHHDWQLKYEEYINSRYRIPFKWGENDCVMLAAGCVLALTGKDLVPEGLTYTTLKEAEVIVAERGGLAGIATSALGDAVSYMFATIGDIVLAKAGDQDMLAICNGAKALAAGPRGLVSVPYSSICWKVK